MLRRVLAGGLLGLVLAGACAASASAACGEPRRAPASGHHVRRPPLILGDSTMIFAAPWLGRHGLEADAKGCRQFAAGVAMLAARRRAHTLPRLSILALGANGPVSSSMIAGALSTIGPGHLLGLVTPRRSPASEASMRRAARSHPDRVLLIDWVGRSAGHGDWFAGDGLHVTPAAGRIFADFVAGRAAVEAPPVRALHLPPQGAKDCGTIRRFGRALGVSVVRGSRRVTCVHARRLARTPPLGAIPGWSAYDWTATGRGPWLDVYARHDRRAVVATVAVHRAPA